MIKLKKILNENYTTIAYRGVSKNTPVDEGTFGKGTYFTLDKEYAKNYGNVFQAEIILKNPFRADISTIDNVVEDWMLKNYQKVLSHQISYADFLEKKSQEITNRLKHKGYDGIIIGDIEIVVFDPKKSVFNMKRLK